MASVVATSVGGWREYRTPEGMTYYHHKERNITQWERPSDWGAPVSPDTAPTDHPPKHQPPQTQGQPQPQSTTPRVQAQPPGPNQAQAGSGPEQRATSPRRVTRGSQRVVVRGGRGRGRPLPANMKMPPTLPRKGPQTSDADQSGVADASQNSSPEQAAQTSQPERGRPLGAKRVMGLPLMGMQLPGMGKPPSQPPPKSQPPPQKQESSDTKPPQEEENHPAVGGGVKLHQDPNASPSHAKPGAGGPGVGGPGVGGPGVGGPGPGHGGPGHGVGGPGPGGVGAGIQISPSSGSEKKQPQRLIVSGPTSNPYQNKMLANHHPPATAVEQKSAPLGRANDMAAGHHEKTPSMAQQEQRGPLILVPGVTGNINAARKDYQPSSSNQSRTDSGSVYSFLQMMGRPSNAPKYSMSVAKKHISDDKTRAAFSSLEDQLQTALDSNRELEEGHEKLKTEFESLRRSLKKKRDTRESKLEEPSERFVPFRVGKSGTSEKVYLCGWMEKEGEKVKNWKKRWFVLYPSYIAYYVHPTNKDPKGTILLNSCTISPYQRRNGVAKSCLELLVEGRHWHFGGDVIKPNVAKQWYNAIKNRILMVGYSHRCQMSNSKPHKAVVNYLNNVQFHKDEDLKPKAFNLTATEISLDTMSIIARILQQKSEDMSWPHCREVSLRKCNMDDMKIQVLSDALHDNLQLIELDLSENEISDECSKNIARFIKSNSTLKKLNLTNCKIDDEAVSSLAEGIAHSRLKTLILRDNTIGNSGASSIANQLLTITENYLPSLTRLLLDGNFIGDGGAQSIAEKLLHDGSILQYLTLSRNMVGPNGAHHLSMCLRSNSSLRYFDVSNNNIEAHGCQAIVHMSQVNQSLEYLAFDTHILHQEGLSVLRLLAGYGFAQRQ